MINLTRKLILQHFLVKIFIQKPMYLNLMHFQDEITHLFFVQKKALKSEGVNFHNLYNILNVRVHVNDFKFSQCVEYVCACSSIR